MRPASIATIGDLAARRIRISDPGLKEGAPNAHEQPNIKDELDRPEQRAHACVGLAVRGGVRPRARRADREHHRASDGMSVGRDHAPAQHVRAALGHRRCRDHHCCVLGHDVANRYRLAVGADQPHHQRRYRLVESQRQHRGRQRQHRAVRRVRSHERCVGAGVGAVRQRDQQHQCPDSEVRHSLRHVPTHVTVSATTSAPAQARGNRRTTFPPPGSRSSGGPPSRTPAPPGNRASSRLRDRRRESR